MERNRLLILLLGGYLCLGGVSPVFGQIFVTTALRYNSCSDNSSPKTTGHELTIPVGIAYKGNVFALSLETAYSHAVVEQGSAGDASLTGLTDTLVSASYTYTFPNRPVGLIVAVDLNLPTGKSRLSDEEEMAEWGENKDLFEVDNFGEGFNAGLSIGLMYQFTRFVFAIQGAYVFKETFDPTSDVADDDLNPGDQLLVIGMFDWQASSWLSVEMSVSFSSFGVDEVHGTEDFQQGNQLGISGSITMTHEPIEVAMRVQTGIPNKNKELVKGTLQSESRNSNGKDFSWAAVITYQVSERLNLWLQGDIRSYGETNSQDQYTGLPYAGKRLRSAVGLGVTYARQQHLSWKGLIEVFTMDQDRDMFTENDVNFRGVKLDLGVTYTL